MYLTLFFIFLAFSIALIALALYRPEHMELGIAGFLFLFLLALVMMAGDVQYKSGVSYSYECMACENGRVCSNQSCTGNTTLVVSSTTDTYTTFVAGGILSHTVGYVLAVVAIIGFIGVITATRRGKNDRW